MAKLLNNGTTKLTLVTEYDDRVETIEAPVTSVTINSNNTFEDVYSDYGPVPMRFQTSQEIVFNTSVPTYTIKSEEKKKVTIIKTAEIEAEDRTVAAYEKARKLAGAPKDAKMRVKNNMLLKSEAVELKLDERWPVVVEFRWKEEV